MSKPVKKYKQEFIEEFLFVIRQRLQKDLPAEADEDFMMKAAWSSFHKGMEHLEKDRKLTYE